MKERPQKRRPGEETLGRLLVGDVRQRLRELQDDSVDCVVTSPPYFRLRNYDHPDQLGLEASVTEWVDHLVGVMDDIARVLKPTGTVWLNLGDSYARHHREGAPPKSLVLAPERLLLALAERGWTVRNRIAWAKPNPMPASVRDRLSCTWEPIYLLTRSRHYYFDLDAIRIPHRSAAPTPKDLPERPRIVPSWQGPLAGSNDGLERSKAQGRVGHVLGKNPGDVWTIAKGAYRGAHFATFPEKLVERPIRAGCPEKVCTACGQPWQRELARTLGRLAVLGELRPPCACRAGHRPGVVLDPFLGSGTTAVVAERLGRDWIGIELNPDCAQLARERLGWARAAADAAASGQTAA